MMAIDKFEQEPDMSTEDEAILDGIWDSEHRRDQLLETEHQLEQNEQD